MLCWDGVKQNDTCIVNFDDWPLSRHSNLCGTAAINTHKLMRGNVGAHNIYKI